MISRIDCKRCMRWLLSFTLTLSMFSPSLAGTPDGPYVVYADLSFEGSTPAIVKSYMDSDRKGLFCGDVARSPLIFIKKRPDGMDDRRLREALINNNQAGRKKLQDLLVTYRLDLTITQGLDGIVAYVDQPKPHMLSLSTVGPIKSVKLRSSRQEAVVEAFCDALPNIHRN